MDTVILSYLKGAWLLPFGGHGKCPVLLLLIIQLLISELLTIYIDDLVNQVWVPG